MSEIENERFPADWATSKHAFAGRWQLTEVKVVHLKMNQGQQDELFSRICSLCCLHKWDADTLWPPRRVVGAWTGKTDRHVHSIPPRYNTGTKLSAKIQLPPSGTWGQVFSTHVLEPDGQCTCLVSVHVSFQARKPNLRLHAGVKKNQPLLLCGCVSVCARTRASWAGEICGFTYLGGHGEQVACCFIKRGDKSAGGVK